jgi:hypothetical protein
VNLRIGRAHRRSPHELRPRERQPRRLIRLARLVGIGILTVVILLLAQISIWVLIDFVKYLWRLL